jgi:uncharacterized protein with HEPN domain
MKGKRNLNLYIDDIQESIEKIGEYTKGINLEEFLKSTQIQDAVLRRLEIIGEAVRNLPDDFKKEHTEIPWNMIAGMRNVVAHEYFGINVKRVWKTIEKDIPELKNKIKNLR